jgi:hypothetical protein
MFKSSNLILCVLVFMCASMLGCASFEKNIETEKLIVQVATMKVIEVGDSAVERSQRAERILSVTNDARTWLTMGGVNLGDLRTALDDRLNELELQPSDRILANMLIDQVLVGLNERIVDGVKMPVPPDEFVYQVNTVLDWIEGAARLY